MLRGETTVGGATVLDPAPPRGRDAERDRLLEAGDPAAIVRALVHEPVRVEELAARALLSGAELEEGLDAARVVDGWAFSEAWLEATAASVVERLAGARARRRRSSPACRSASSCPSRGRRPCSALLPVERRGATVVLPGTSASLGAREDLAADAGGGSRLGRARGDEGRGRRAGAVSRGRGPARPARRRLRGRAGAYEVARDLVVTECATAGEITLGALPRPRRRRPARRAAPARADGRRRASRRAASAIVGVPPSRGAYDAEASHSGSASVPTASATRLM